MHEDNLVPNNGEAFIRPEPTPEEKERDQELNDLLAQVPVIKKVIARMNDRIKYLSSVDAIPDAVKTKPDEFMHIVAANKLAKDEFVSEKEWLEELVSLHLK